jgi:hypothetical protein
VVAGGGNCRVIPRSVSRVLLAYAPVVLVAGSLASGASAASATVGLVVLYVSCLLAAWWPGFTVAALASVLVAPVLLAPYVGNWSVLLALPAYAAVARGFEGLAPKLIAAAPQARRSLSPLALSVGGAIVVVLVTALVVAAPTLALTSGCLLLAMSLTAAVQYARLGSRPLHVECLDVTVRAGERVTIDLEVVPAARGGLLFALMAPEGAVLRNPGPFAPDDRAHKSVTLAPLLGGPSDVVVRASVTDSFGLVHLGQSLTAAHLNVIPRARVARWVAEEFLAHRGGGVEAGGALSREVAGLLATLGGVEYLSSRLYVPGDTLLSIDWKHTSRLQSLVLKTFDDGTRSAGLILVNLSATDADEADRLEYEFLSAALTVATMSCGASIAAYGGRGKSELTRLLFGDALVRASLDACPGVSISPAWRRYSRPVSVQRVRAQVVRARGAGATKLSALLALKERAVQSFVDSAPVGPLLLKAAHQGLPAWCVAISTMHRDAEAVLTGLHDLEGRGVGTSLVDVGLPFRRRGAEMMVPGTRHASSGRREW